MKAIIIAAGLGSRLNLLTQNKPKCLLEVNGKTILERQLELLRACGIDDISLIKGYKGEAIDFPGIKYYTNTNYRNNNILNSLFYAEKEMDGEFVVLYSDILFDKSVVEKLLKNKEDISAIVDVDWQEYYQGRTEHPIEEAENVIIQDENIIKIGKYITADEAEGEFIGMVKFSEKGADVFKGEFQRAKAKYWCKPFRTATTFEKAYLTDMLQELIDGGYNISSVKILQDWWEIDTEQDLKKVENIFRNYN